MIRLVFDLIYLYRMYPVMDEVAQCIGCLADRMKKIGFEIVTDRGDYKADI